MPPRKESQPSFTPMGAINRPYIYQTWKDRKIPTHDQRQKIVRVVWDCNTTPLKDSDNNLTYEVQNLRNSINEALRKISPHLEVEAKMFAAGDKKHFLGTEEEFDTLFRRLESPFSFLQCDDRFFHCQKRLCKIAGVTAKENPEVFTGLQEHVLGDAIERESPGIILLISADSDFGSALEFLRQRGFVVILAQAEHSNVTFRNHAHYTFFWKNLRDGRAPTYQCL